MENEYSWLIEEDESDQLRPKNIDRGDGIQPWDDSAVSTEFRRDYTARRQFRCRIVREQPTKGIKKSDPSQPKIINCAKFKQILDSTNRTAFENKSSSRDKTRQMRDVLRLHQSRQIQDIRYVRKRNPKMVYESVKCREIRADQSDLPVFGQSVRYDPWVSRRNRLISSTSPVAVIIPEHLKFLFDKPKTRAGGASMNTRFSIGRQHKTSKTEADQPDAELFNNSMRIMGMRLSTDHTEKSPNHTSYGGF